jgi:hypothetical protein
MVWRRMKERAEVFGLPWMLVLGGQPSWIVTTRVEADMNIYIVIKL